MNKQKLFLVLAVALLPSAAFADEIGSGEIDPPRSYSTTTTSPGTEIENTDASGGDPTVEGDSLLQQLLDWIQ